jgi:hypothetical protein
LTFSKKGNHTYLHICTGKKLFNSYSIRDGFHLDRSCTGNSVSPQRILPVTQTRLYKTLFISFSTQSPSVSKMSHVYLHLEVFREFLSVYVRLNSPCGPWLLFRFPNLYTVNRVPWTGDQPCLKAATCTQDNTNRINAHRQPCLEWGSNSRSLCLSGRKRFMP